MFYDANIAQEFEEFHQRQHWKGEVRAGRARTFRNPRTGSIVYRQIEQGFRAGPSEIKIHYHNFLGEPKTFVGDWRTLRRRGIHVSLMVEPTGTRIALHLDRIQNRTEVEQALTRCPSSREQQVLRYHLRRRSTSERFEELRTRYPEWSQASATQSSTD